MAGGALAIFIRRSNSFAAHLPQLESSGSCPLARPQALRIRCARQRLFLVYPFLINTVVVADQNATPGADEFFECLFRPIGMYHKEGDNRIGHHPQPIELTTLVPGRLSIWFIRDAPGLVFEGLIMCSMALDARSITFWIAPKLMGM